MGQAIQMEGISSEKIEARKINDFGTSYETIRDTKSFTNDVLLTKLDHLAGRYGNLEFVTAIAQEIKLLIAQK